MKVCIPIAIYHIESQDEIAEVKSTEREENGKVQVQKEEVAELCRKERA